MTTNSEPRTVIGVMPPEFTIVGRKADFFVPYGWTMERLRRSPGRGISHGIARLRAEATFDQAAAEMKNIAAQLEKEFPQRNAGWSVTLVPIHEQMVDQIRPALLVLAGAVSLVLLIACVNVANLLLARSTVRQRELGIRTALGAKRGRLVRQMLTESLLLGAAGGVAGLALAFAFHRGLLALGATPHAVFRMVLGQALGLIAAGVAAGLVAAVGLTRLLETLLYETEPLDAVTFAATVFVLVAVATVASYVPARRGTRVAPVEALREP